MARHNAVMHTGGWQGGACPWCGAAQAAPLYPASDPDWCRPQAFRQSFLGTAHGPYARCGACGLVYVFPAPPGEALLAAAQGADRDDDYVQEWFWRFANDQQVARQLRQHVAGGRVLEVGAGQGCLAQALAADFNVVAVDLNAANLGLGQDRLAYQGARKIRPGLSGPVWQGFVDPCKRKNPLSLFARPDVHRASGKTPRKLVDFAGCLSTPCYQPIGALAEALPFAGNSFDAVLCMHLIEHVLDPRALLLELVRVLKPGGVLVLETPDEASTLARRTGAKWWYLMAYHLTLWPQNLLVRAMAATGLEVTLVQRPLRVWGLGYLARRAAARHRWLTPAAWLVNTLPTRRWLLPLRPGDIVRVLARKR